MIYTTSERAVLPNELHGEIVGHLDPTSDQLTLLNLALCSHSFRTESQRLLFGNMNLVQNLYRDRPDSRALWVHHQFLQVIIDSPHRLALYVHTYSQCAVALEPKCRFAKHSKKGQVRVRILELTEKALPLMRNLKHLEFDSYCEHGVALSILWRQCVFQLESIYATMSAYDLHHNFLPRQHALRHLGIQLIRNSERLQLSDNIHPPSLTSLECTYTEFESLAPVLGQIFAWHDSENGDDFGLNTVARRQRHDQYPENSLRRLKYLRAGIAPGFFEAAANYEFSNLVLLRLPVWVIEDLHHLPWLPQIIVLALTVGDQLHAEPTGTRDAASIALSRCATLGCVLMLDRWLPYTKCYSRNSSQNEVDESPGDGAVDVVEEHVQLEWQSSSPIWWKIYEPFLQQTM